MGKHPPIPVLIFYIALIPICFAGSIFVFLTDSREVLLLLPTLIAAGILRVTAWDSFRDPFDGCSPKVAVVAITVFASFIILMTPVIITRFFYPEPFESPYAYVMSIILFNGLCAFTLVTELYYSLKRRKENKVPDNWPESYFQSLEQESPNNN